MIAIIIALVTCAVLLTTAIVLFIEETPGIAMLFFIPACLIAYVIIPAPIW